MTPQDIDELAPHCMTALAPKVDEHNRRRQGVIGGIGATIAIDALLPVVKGLLAVVSNNFSGTVEDFLVSHREVIDSVIPDVAFSAAIETLSRLRSSAGNADA